MAGGMAWVVEHLPSKMRLWIQTPEPPKIKPKKQNTIYTKDLHYHIIKTENDFSGWYLRQSQLILQVECDLTVSIRGNFLFLIGGGMWDWIQGFALARQALYRLSHSISPARGNFYQLKSINPTTFSNGLFFTLKYLDHLLIKISHFHFFLHPSQFSIMTVIIWGLIKSSILNPNLFFFNWWYWCLAF
jgi:hypothetical protein